LTKIEKVESKKTVGDLRKLIVEKCSNLNLNRIALRTEIQSKNLSDSVAISSLGLEAKNGQIFVKDLGPQIGWKTVFLIEYAGPFFIYPLFYLFPKHIYGNVGRNFHHHFAQNLALGCYCFHFGKRLLETIFVHRFSHATMPIKNLFKNCSYYWGFAAFVAYFGNHPLYTPATFGNPQIYAGLIGFILCECGNYAIHAALRDLRPQGTSERRIPQPTSNPFTKLFSVCSCPNYTYEIGAWVCFSIMTQSLPALLFTIMGGFQMTIWALGKHRQYRKEFEKYPKSRKAIFPFIF